VFFFLKCKGEERTTRTGEQFDRVGVQHWVKKEGKRENNTVDKVK